MSRKLAARFLADNGHAIMFDVPDDHLDWSCVDGRFIVAMHKQTAIDLMHMLEEWKDER